MGVSNNSRPTAKIALMLGIVVALIVQSTSGLFFTDSKENDYPRIGRRSGIVPSSEERRWLLDVMKPNIHGGIALQENRKVLARIAVKLFKALDTDGDGFLSSNEFEPEIMNFLAL